MNVDKYAEQVGQHINAEIANFKPADQIQAFIQAVQAELLRNGLSKQDQQRFWRLVAIRVRNFSAYYTFKSQNAQALNDMVSATASLLEELARRATQ